MSFIPFGTTRSILKSRNYNFNVHSHHFFFTFLSLFCGRKYYLYLLYFCFFMIFFFFHRKNLPFLEICQQNSKKNRDGSNLLAQFCLVHIGVKMAFFRKNIDTQLIFAGYFFFRQTDNGFQQNEPFDSTT
jgi:hypothetical protein